MLVLLFLLGVLAFVALGLPSSIGLVGCLCLRNLCCCCCCCVEFFCFETKGTRHKNERRSIPDSSPSRGAARGRLRAQGAGRGRGADAPRRPDVGPCRHRPGRSRRCRGARGDVAGVPHDRAREPAGAPHVEYRSPQNPTDAIVLQSLLDVAQRML